MGAIVSDVVVVEVSTELLVVVVSKPEISLVWVQYCQITRVHLKLLAVIG